jgi:hypothetical protein
MRIRAPGRALTCRGAGPVRVVKKVNRNEQNLAEPDIHRVRSCEQQSPTLLVHRFLSGPIFWVPIWYEEAKHFCCGNSLDARRSAAASRVQESATTGEQGQSGEQGQVGQLRDFDQGQVGQNGQFGQLGQFGEFGRVGESGQSGETGQLGERGESG